MQLVSAIWEDFHPFDTLPGIKDFRRAEDPDDLKPGDILISHGGEDISPALYNQGRSQWTGAGSAPSRRDSIEWALMNRARELGNPIIGLCRGAQMLCALSGGILIQHVEGHSGMHQVLTRDNKKFNVNSIHHQMQYPWINGCKHEIIAWSKHRLSNCYFVDDDEELEPEVEPEFVYYPEVKGFAFQWHPEMMDADSDASKYILSFIKEKLCL